jgi:hypothetical protein
MFWQLECLELREYEAALKRLNRQVSDIEEDELPPSVKLELSSVDFGQVR